MWRVCVVWCDFDSDETYKGREVVSNACGVWDAKRRGTSDLVTSLLWRVNLIIRLWECDRPWRRLSRLQTSIKPHGTTYYLLPGCVRLVDAFRQSYLHQQWKGRSITLSCWRLIFILDTHFSLAYWADYQIIFGFSLDYVRESCPSSLRCPSLTVQLFGTFRAQHEADVRTLRISCGRIEFMLFNSKSYKEF